MIVARDIPLARHTTLRVGGPAGLFVTVEQDADIPEAVAIARDHGAPIAIIGGGSNVLAHDGRIDRCVMRMAIRGIGVIAENDDEVVVRVGAGEPWGAFVSWALGEGLWGVENLAGIPGTVGATPVQNVGAYGAEVADIIEHVDVFDSVSMSWMTLSNASCAFGYRDSIFKRQEGERFIIASVTMRLSKTPRPKLLYKDIAERCAGMSASALTPSDIARAVLAIRAGKFPDLRLVGTAGSFFKNPVVTEAHYRELGQRFPGIPGHDAGNGIKVPLAWILDRVCNLKGHRVGAVELYNHQPLVLVAHDGATAQSIDAFARDVAHRVHDATNIIVEREVRELRAT